MKVVKLVHTLVDMRVEMSASSWGINGVVRKEIELDAMLGCMTVSC